MKNNFNSILDCISSMKDLSNDLSSSYSLITLLSLCLIDILHPSFICDGQEGTQIQRNAIQFERKLSSKSGQKSNKKQIKENINENINTKHKQNQMMSITKRKEDSLTNKRKKKKENYPQPKILYLLSSLSFSKTKKK